MDKKKTSLEIRREQREALLLACDRALTEARERAKAQDLGQISRKSWETLSRYIAVPLEGDHAIRAPGTYQTRHYNLGRQILGLASHAFISYRVPRFLYRAVLTRAGMQVAFTLASPDEEMLRECGKRRFVRWFMVAAQGGSLAKEMSGVLTRKEAHYFMQAPTRNSIYRNLFWAKCSAAGIHGEKCQEFTERFASKEQQKQMGQRASDLIRFLAVECQHLRGNDLQEVMDFIRAMIRDPEFSFKGRTLSSMIKLSDDWHRSIYSTTVTKSRSWPQTFAPWIHEKKDHCVKVIELTTSNALADEGRKQRHCVYSYEENCLRGWSKILSMRWVVPADDLAQDAEVLRRLTIEVNHQQKEVVQVRGRFNRDADEHEMKMVRLWAGQHGYRIAEWY